MTDLQPRISAARSVLALFDRDLEVVAGHPDRAGGEVPTSIDTVYIEISTTPGGHSDQIQGWAVLDIDCYARDYDTAESAAFDVEALLLGYPHVVEVGGRTVVIDSVEQNIGPADRPWEDDSVYRIGATYVITARRR